MKGRANSIDISAVDGRANSIDFAAGDFTSTREQCGSEVHSIESEDVLSTVPEDGRSSPETHGKVPFTLVFLSRAALLAVSGVLYHIGSALEGSRSVFWWNVHKQLAESMGSHHARLDPLGITHLAGCEDLNSLLDKFLDEKWFDRQGGVMTSFTRSTLLCWVQEARGQSVREVQLNPPNCPAAVLSWYGCLQLLQSLCEEDREKLVTYPLRERPEEMTPLTSVKAADGHFHLESLPTDAAALQGLFWMDGAMGEPTIRIDLDIWNCVFARSWEFPLPATGVTIRRTYGVHPRLAGQQLPWFTLLRLFGAEECCGIGECGLDETAPNMEAQEELFKTQVRAALRKRKPLVLHLRSTSSSTALLHQRARTLMAAVLNKSHRVYLHCFVGTWDMYMKWNQAFPQLLLGFSRLTMEMMEFQKQARSLPLHQLMLESDSPHLGHSPRQLIDQAIAVAECRNLPMAAVLEGTRRNVEKFFS